jgi:hypothetical protein
MRLRQKPTGETGKIVSARKETPAGLEHWPDDIWSDYPFAYVRLTTLRVAREIHLLFGCVEMLPREIQPLPDYYAPRLKLRRGATATSSLTVLTLEAALRWYEDSRSGVLAIPGTDGPARVRTACLAPEPRLGNLVVARTPTVPVSWHSGPRMHRMVPMDALPEAVTGRLAPTPDGSALHAWLIEHCFIDLVANPDCAGGLVLLAANPIVRGVSEYPLRKLPDGREVLGVKLVPRSGSSLDTIRVRLSELRPDGHSLMQEVSLDPFGEAEVILPQEAQDTALEVSCTRRGLLSAPPHTGFLRSVGFEIRPVRATMSVEVPARSKRQDRSRYKVPVAASALTVASLVGRPAESGAAARLALLLGTRTAAVGRPTEEIVFGEDRQFAVSFVRSLVSHAMSRLLFVDPYFSFDDVRDFALSAWSGSCRVSILTSARAAWTKPLGHLATDKPHGELMVTDLEAINRVRTRNGLLSVNVGVMNVPGFHDRFLVVDDAVWLFGNSFRSLGDGTVSMASKVRDASILLPMLVNASTEAESFVEFWGRTKPKGGAT